MTTNSGSPRRRWIPSKCSPCGRSTPERSISTLVGPSLGTFSNAVTTLSTTGFIASETSIASSTPRAGRSRRPPLRAD